MMHLCDLLPPKIRMLGTIPGLMRWGAKSGNFQSCWNRMERCIISWVVRF